jgi:DNA-binding CsgD family transcriptional regulator
VKDGDGRVLMQDEHCISICGNRVGTICSDGCMALAAVDRNRQWRDWGSNVYANSDIHGTLCDVTIIRSPNNITTFLQPLEAHHQAALDSYAPAGLTPREEEVLALILLGQQNNDIAVRLDISLATLRTHLNRIYTKLRQRNISTEFLPGCRTRPHADD